MYRNDILWARYKGISEIHQHWNYKYIYVKQRRSHKYQAVTAAVLLTMNRDILVTLFNIVVAILQMTF